MTSGKPCRIEVWPTLRSVGFWRASTVYCVAWPSIVPDSSCMASGPVRTEFTTPRKPSDKNAAQTAMHCQWTFHRLTYIITSLNGFLWLLLSCNLQECDLPPAGPAKAKPKTPAEAELLQLLGAVGIHVLGEPGASKSVQPPGWIGSFCGCTAASAAMASAEALLNQLPVLHCCPTACFKRKRINIEMIEIKLLNWNCGSHQCSFETKMDKTERRTYRSTLHHKGVHSL